ncbi:MAG: DUF4173 domain-containing protein [Oscillospiraceae bacterium]|nr:DUF4173 domain-containing protein [Oscillospiraceae bacterium]
MNENTRTSMDNAIGEIKVSQKTDIPATKYDKTDSLFTIMYILLGYGFVRFFILDFYYESFRFTLPVYTVAYIATVLAYARRKGITPQKEAYFWTGVMLCVAFLFKIENFFRLFIQTVVAAYFTAMAGGLYGGGTSGYIWADGIHTFISAPFSHFVSIFPAFFSLLKKKDRKGKLKLSPAVGGVLMAAVALWFIMPLLIKADNNFLSVISDFIKNLFTGFNPGDAMFTFMVHAIPTVPVACYLYSLGYSVMNNTGRLFDKNELDNSREKIRISPALTLKVFLYIVCFVYLLFIMLQAEYLLGAFMGRLYGNMTYAQYARTGFFELCKVSVINLTLLAIVNLLIKKEENKAVKLPMLVLCVLSLLLLSTATAKMAMYICAYGLTVKRVISTVFLMWLIAVFVMCIIRLYKPFNLVKAAVITGAVMFCVLFSFDIGLHSDNFNEKYGFEEKTVQFETVFDGAVYLPAKSEITWINVHHSKDPQNSYSLSDINKFYRIMQNADYTDLSSVQDFPMREEYYIITVYPDMFENKPDVVIYCYEKDGQIFLEQPYNGIWTTEENLPYMFDNYRF